MSGSVRCTCRKVISNKLETFQNLVREIMLEENITREAAIEKVYPKIGIFRTCCKGYLLTHIEFSNKRLFIHKMALLEDGLRPSNRPIYCGQMTENMEED